MGNAHGRMTSLIIHKLTLYGSFIDAKYYGSNYIGYNLKQGLLVQIYILEKI